MPKIGYMASANNFYMKKYKQAAINIAILTLLMTAGIASNYFFEGRKSGQDDAVSGAEERVLSAFDDNNYSDWKKMNKNRKIVSFVGEKDFEDFLAARSAARSGNYEESVKICDDLENRLNEKIKNLSSTENRSQTYDLKSKLTIAKEALLKDDDKEWKNISGDFRREIAFL
jgi:hypothetical protein